MEKIISNSFKELFNRLKASTGLIFVNTFEENRLIREVKTELPEGKIFFWSVSQGLHELVADSKGILKKPQDYTESECIPSVTSGKKTTGIPDMLNTIEHQCRKKIESDLHQLERNVYILRDLDKHFNNPALIRKIRDIIYVVSTSSSSVILCSPGITVPTDLEKDCTFINLEMPTKTEIRDYILKSRVKDIIKIHNQDIVDGKGTEEQKMEETFDEEEITRACMGLTEEEIINTTAYSLTVNKKVEPKIILEEKRQIISKNDILTYHNCNETLSSLGGFKNLKEWFIVQRSLMDYPEYAELYSADQPKGILLLGVQGSGKTLAAKAMASDWGKGLIVLEMGKIFAGLVGESEKRCRMALMQAVAAGGILLIDELDKGLAGAGSSDRTDGGTTKRVIGTLLSWMQEPHPGLFIIATANDITNLREAHPELLRKGRFDELWFSDAPNETESAEIIQIHLKKRNRNIDNFDIDKLAKIKYIDKGIEFKYVGAEYEYAIQQAVGWSFAKNFKGKPINITKKNDITTQDIEDHLRKIIPISKVGKLAVENNRKWAMDNARNVSEFDTKNNIKINNSTDSFKGNIRI